MGTCGPQLERKGQIGMRVQHVEGTVETLTSFDYQTRMIVGTTPDYSPEREQRDIARPTLTRLGSIEGTKPLSIPFSSEINTPDSFNLAATADMDVDTIAWQSGNTVRVDFNGTPDLSAVQDGSYITINYAGDTANNGTFLVIAVSDVSDYVDIINFDVSDNSHDEATDSPAVGDIQQNLEYQAGINISGAKVSGLSRIAIGAITNGPYQHGETITGYISSATGRVVVPAVTGDSYIYFEPLTGTFQNSETITGGTSTATCTSGGTPHVHGYNVKPISSCQPVGTVEYEEDEYAWKIRDAMANFVITAPANKRAIIEISPEGARSSIGDKATTTSVTRGNEDPPVSKNSDLTLGGTFEPVWSQWVFDTGNETALRENGNTADDTGIEGNRITGRVPKLTLSCEHELAAVYDFYTKLDAGTKISFSTHVGNAETKQMWLFCDELETDTLSAGSNNGIRTLELNYMCTGDAASADDEWEMAFIGN